ncbi:hypothetical protein CsatB_010867 [Cannabis sativa]
MIRRRRNQIVELFDTEGKKWEDKKHLTGIINNYFGNLFKFDIPCIPDSFDDMFVNKLNEGDNISFAECPTFQEVREVVFELHPLKAPGPDGLSGCFYRRYWDIVGKDVCSAVREFFQSGRLNPKLNYSFTFLIPKVENSTKMEQFRPISLCNFVYKIIAKILSNRLRPLMERLISPYQSAFIPGRWIAEASILTQEIVHTIKKR